MKKIIIFPLGHGGIKTNKKEEIISELKEKVLQNDNWYIICELTKDELLNSEVGKKLDRDEEWWQNLTTIHVYLEYCEYLERYDIDYVFNGNELDHYEIDENKQANFWDIVIALYEKCINKKDNTN